jgi:hypothetical protein
MPLPPARYRVEERGRRLVTIDIRTGQEYGADIGHARAQKRDAGDATGPTSQPASAPRSALSALAANLPDRARAASTVQGQGKPGVAGKLVVLAMGSLLLIAFLIMTNLWFFAVIPLAIPQVRTVVLTRGKAMLRKYLDQAATG